MFGKSCARACDPDAVRWLRSRLVAWRRPCQLGTFDLLREVQLALPQIDETNFHEHMAAAGFERAYPRSLTGPYRARWLDVPSTATIEQGEALVRVVTAPFARVTAADLSAVSLSMRVGYITSRAGAWTWTKYTREAGIANVHVDKRCVLADAPPGAPFRPAVVQAAFAHPRHYSRLVRADEARIFFYGVPKEERVELLRDLVQLTRPRLRLILGGAS